MKCVTDDCSTDFISSFISMTNCRPCNCSISCQAPQQVNEENTCSLSWLDRRQQGSQMLLWWWCEHMHLVRAPQDRIYGRDIRQEVWEMRYFKQNKASDFCPFFLCIVLKNWQPFCLRVSSISRILVLSLGQNENVALNLLQHFLWPLLEGLFLLQPLLSAVGLCSLHKVPLTMQAHLTFVIPANGKQS